MNCIISDIHGCFHTLVKLVDRVRKLDPDSKLIFVGDYVDRGHHNKDVIEYLIELQKDGAVCLRGNHDNVIDWILNDGHYLGNIQEFVCGEPCSTNVLRWWSRNGLAETLVSYGCQKHNEICQTDQDWEAVRQEFVENCPDDHKTFFRDLPIYWESDTHFACHAFYPTQEEVPLDFKFVPAKYVDDVLWTRFSSTHLSHPTRWDRIGVFGHTPVSYYGATAPVSWENIRLIDTGAFSGNYLCAYLCEADEHVLQSTDSRDKLSAQITQDVNFEPEGD